MTKYQKMEIPWDAQFKCMFLEQCINPFSMWNLYRYTCITLEARVKFFEDKSKVEFAGISGLNHVPPTCIH